MTTLQIQSQVSLNTLLDSLKQLDANELALVAQEAAVLQAQQRAPHLSEEETALLLKINQGVVPEQIRNRCAVLSAKSREGTIAAEEYEELMTLIDQIETLNAERIGYLVELAQLRQMSLDEVMQMLEIQPLSYE
jgi:hypothetical protein